MRKLIDQQQEVERIQNKLNEVFQYPKTEYAEGFVNACNAVLRMLDSLPAAQPEIIRCRDCKHRPTGTNSDDLEFPDDKCPCQCEDDFWYSWKPSDNWFCGNGERKECNDND